MDTPPPARPWSVAHSSLSAWRIRTGVVVHRRAALDGPVGPNPFQVVIPGTSQRDAPVRCHPPSVLGREWDILDAHTLVASAPGRFTGPLGQLEHADGIGGPASPVQTQDGCGVGETGAHAHPAHRSRIDAPLPIDPLRHRQNELSPGAGLSHRDGARSAERQVGSQHRQSPVPQVHHPRRDRAFSHCPSSSIGLERELPDGGQAITMG